MFSEYHHEAIWAASWEELDELEPPTHYHNETMVTALFNGPREWFLNVLPRSRSVDRKYFAEEIVGGLKDVCYPEWRNSHERKITLHFDNGPIHNARRVMRQLEHS
jgi:hypothetical protein